MSIRRKSSASFSAAAAYLDQTDFKSTGKKVLVIGEKGIPDELDLIGVPYIGAEDMKGMNPTWARKEARSRRGCEPSWLASTAGSTTTRFSMRSYASMRFRLHHCY